MNAGAKGYRNERKTIAHFEALGYECVRSGGSKGVFDLVCISSTDIVLAQVKSNRNVGPDEREAMRQFPAPPNARKLCVRWDDRKRQPRVTEV